MEDVPLADCLVSVMRSELCQRPIGNVLSAVAPVLVVGCRRENIGFFRVCRETESADSLGYEKVCCFQPPLTQIIRFSVSVSGRREERRKHTHSMVHHSVKIEIRFRKRAIERLSDFCIFKFCKLPTFEFLF